MMQCKPCIIGNKKENGIEKIYFFSSNSRASNSTLVNP